MCIKNNNTMNNQLITRTTSTEKNCENSNKSKFLGIVEKRYIRTFHGIIHGLGSTIALVVGNLVFANRVLLGNTGPIQGSTMNLIFHACNFIASATTALFFWNKVQSWQLSTTTMKEKGLTPRTLQRFNQGRGVVTMLSYSLFPLVCSAAPQYLLENRIFSTGVALSLIAGSVYTYKLIQDYGAKLWLVYGMNPMAMGISILTSTHGTMACINKESPLAMDRFQKDAAFVISCVQMGFMMYYLYSRKLVTQKQVQTICKTYHCTLAIIYLMRVERDLWTYFSSSNTSSIPLALSIHPMILTLVLSRLFVKMLKAKMAKKNSTATTTTTAVATTTTTTTTTPIKEASTSTELTSSVQKLQSVANRRSSSLKARIDTLTTSCNGVN